MVTLIVPGLANGHFNTISPNYRAKWSLLHIWVQLAQLGSATTARFRRLASEPATMFSASTQHIFATMTAAVLEMSGLQLYPAPTLDNSNPGNSAPIFSHSLCEWCDICSEWGFRKQFGVFSLQFPFHNNSGDHTFVTPLSSLYF